MWDVGCGWAIIRKAGRTYAPLFSNAFPQTQEILVEKFSCSGHCLNGFMGSFAVVIGVEMLGIVAFQPPPLLFLFLSVGFPNSAPLIRSFISLMGCKWGASFKVNYTLTPESGTQPAFVSWNFLKKCFFLYGSAKLRGHKQFCISINRMDTRHEINRNVNHGLPRSASLDEMNQIKYLLFSIQ